MFVLTHNKYHRSRPKYSPVHVKYQRAKVYFGWLGIVVNGSSNPSLIESANCLQSLAMGPASRKVPIIFVLSYQDKLEMNTSEP